MALGISGGQLAGGYFPQMGEAPSFFLGSDGMDLSESISTDSEAGTGENAPFFNGVEVNLSPGAMASMSS